MKIVWKQVIFDQVTDRTRLCNHDADTLYAELLHHNEPTYKKEVDTTPTHKHNSRETYGILDYDKHRKLTHDYGTETKKAIVRLLRS